MKTNRLRQNVLPVLTALIWGVAIVFQGVGADYLEPFTFNAARSSVAFLFLLLLCAVLRLTRRRSAGGEVPGGVASGVPAGSADRGILLRRRADGGGLSAAEGAGDHHPRQDRLYTIRQLKS